MSITLQELAQAAGAELSGDGTVIVSGVASLQSAGPDQIGFLANSRYRKFLDNTRAAAVILTPEHVAHCPTNALISTNPHLAYARIATILSNATRQSPSGLHPSAWVSADARVDQSAWIGPQAVVEPGAYIGPACFVGPGSVVGEGAELGEGTRLVANVTICHGAQLGRRVLVHPGAVIGADGFGLANDQGRWIKVPQLGGVVIGDDVEIGANTTIDRGALEDTVLEEGVKLDNLIQVAHNVQVGAHTAMAGCVGIAGSVTIGRRCTLGGGVGVAGHLRIADNVHITGMSLVTKSITEPGVYSSGLAVEPNRVWNKVSARLRRLDELARRVLALEKKTSSGPHNS